MPEVENAVESQVEKKESAGGNSDIPFQNTDVSKLKIKGVDDDYGKTDSEEEDKEEGADGKSGEKDKKEEPKAADEGKKPEDPATGKETKPDDTGDTGKVDEPEKKSYSQQEFETSVNTIVSKISGNSLKNVGDIPKILAENAKLKKDLENKEPVFANEREKQLFDYSKKATGFELQAAQQFLHVMSLGDVKKLSDKDAQFEAFLLTRPDLSRTKAQTLFDADYVERYPDLENNILQADKHEVATREAKEKLAKMQDDFSKAKTTEESPDQNIDPKVTEAIHKSIDDSLDGFEGMKIPFGETDEEKLSLPLSQEEVSEFRQFLKEPIKLIEGIIERCSDQEGVLDVEAYTYEMFTVFKRHELADEANKLGRTLGELKHIQDKKNVNEKKDSGKEVKTKKSFEETMVDAVSLRIKN